MVIGMGDKIKGFGVLCSKEQVKKGIRIRVKGRKSRGALPLTFYPLPYTFLILPF